MHGRSPGEGDAADAAPPAQSRVSHRPIRALPLRVGTRGSPLALQQTRAFLRRLVNFCPVLRDADAFAEEIIRTTGDRVQDRKLAEIGGKGLFAKEIHEALLAARIDVAVHSLKDLETTLEEGVALACTLRREDARDALILRPGLPTPDPADPFAVLPRGAVIGTASVRRQAQLLAVRPDLACVLLRGNVETRLAKVEAGELDATLLAHAGLVRLGLQARATLVLDPEGFVPAAGQGIVGVTVRSAEPELRELLAAIEDPVAAAVSTAERSMLAALDGSCHTPIGGHAVIGPDGTLRLTGLIASEDGRFLVRRDIRGAPTEAARLGQALGAELRALAPPSLFV